jgi:hypothetical protein
MPDTSRFRTLKVRERALVAVAVLLDGYDAAEYLSRDLERAPALMRAAKDLAELSPDLRIPLVGTLLRSAVSELNGG